MLSLAVISNLSRFHEEPDLKILQASRAPYYTDVSTDSNGVWYEPPPVIHVLSIVVFQATLNIVMY